MTKRSFRHGLHPHGDGKGLTAEAAIREFRPAGEAVYPLGQHIGKPAKPVVSVGDPVLVGQTLAEPDGFVSAAICSGVSGKVKAIEPRMTVSGKQQMAVVVDNDGQFTPCPELGQERDYTAMTGEEILAAVRDAGIVGQGGAGFPAHVKLTMKPGVSPDTLLINAAECEPYLTSDYRMMLENTGELLEGIRVLLHLFPEASAVIAVEDNKPQAIRRLWETVGEDARIRVQVLKTKYPQGGERMLIAAVTGRKVHSGCLPIDAGCVVLNVSTTVSVARAVCRHIPQIYTVMTVTGDGTASPCNLKVPVGSSHREVLEAAGGLTGEVEKLISGGPMMGMAMASLDVPVVKTSSSILAMRRDEVAMWEPSACIRCGKCIRVCPEFLVPVEMARAADSFDLEAYQKLGGMECIACGCCTYVCPAKRRLTQSFQYARTAIAAARRRQA